MTVTIGPTRSSYKTHIEGDIKVDETGSGADYVRKKAEESQSIPVLIALFGQPGAGKSSLINTISGQNLAKIGVENDVTTARDDYQWNGLTFSDLPGYGTAKFPASEYFATFNILSFDIFLCVVSEKLRDSDIAFFHALAQAGKKCIFVRNKIDTIYEDGVPDLELRQRILENLRVQIGGVAPIILASCRTKEGLDAVVNTINNALPGVKRDRFRRSAAAYSKEFLEMKKEACRSYALWIAAAAGVANAVPVPGVGFAADLTAIVGAMTAIRADFGLSVARLDKFAIVMPGLAPIARNVLEFATREGAILLLKRFAGAVAAAEASKYIPIVGPIFAGSVSFLTIRFLLAAYIDDCYEIAAEMLESHFQF